MFPAINLKANYLKWIFVLLSIAAFIPFLNPTSANASNEKELCTGANLTFDTSRNNSSCKTNNQGEPCKGSSKDCSSDKSINDLITQIINIFSIIVGIAAVIMIIYGGFRYITSGGDSGNISTAKNIIIYAIVGLVIVALAQIIVKFVLDKATSPPDPDSKKSSLIIRTTA